MLNEHKERPKEPDPILLVRDDILAEGAQDFVDDVRDDVFGKRFRDLLLDRSSDDPLFADDTVSFPLFGSALLNLVELLLKSVRSRPLLYRFVSSVSFGIRSVLLVFDSRLQRVDSRLEVVGSSTLPFQAFIQRLRSSSSRLQTEVVGSLLFSLELFGEIGNLFGGSLGETGDLVPQRVRSGKLSRGHALVTISSGPFLQPSASLVLQLLLQRPVALLESTVGLGVGRDLGHDLVRLDLSLELPNPSILLRDRFRVRSSRFGEIAQLFQNLGVIDVDDLLHPNLVGLKLLNPLRFGLVGTAYLLKFRFQPSDLVL
jgi:hypothetical protein